MLLMVVVGWLASCTVVYHVCAPCCITWMVLVLLRLIRVIQEVVLLVLVHCRLLILWLRLRVLLLQGWCDVLLIPRCICCDSWTSSVGEIVVVVAECIGLCMAIFVCLRLSCRLN